MCLIIGLALFGPRIIGVVWWLADSARWTAAFGENFLLPALGVLFLPWLTIVYVLTSPEGITGLDIVWIIVAAVADMGSYLGGGFGERRRRSSSYKACQ